MFVYNNVSCFQFALWNPRMTICGSKNSKHNRGHEV